MLDRRSALSSARPYASPILQIGEARGFSLLQVAGPAKAISPITGKLPAKVGTALQADGRTLLRTGENSSGSVGPEDDATAAGWTATQSSRLFLQPQHASVHDEGARPVMSS
jgi:hypothetical protein